MSSQSFIILVDPIHRNMMHFARRLRIGYIFCSAHHDKVSKSTAQSEVYIA